MLRKLILALMLVLSGPALAQSFPRPPDVPTYSPVAATYAAGVTQNVLGNGSNASGGTPPAFSYELADIPTTSRTAWVVTGTYGDVQGFCSAPNGTFNAHGCPEPKFRTHAQFSHVLYDDPIRNYGLPGTSHCHMFFGNRGTNAYSTYASQRNEGLSTATGGMLNKTGYWHPCLVKTNPFADGKDYAVKMNFYVIYYNGLSVANALQDIRIPRGLRYVGGYPMDDPDDTQQKKEIATANAQASTAGRYSYQGNGFIGWRCAQENGTFSKSFKTSAGGDAFTAQTSATCLTGTMEATITGPECWDGVNLWSPGGYLHMRNMINDNQSTNPDKLVCPNGWFRLPQLQLLMIFSHTGYSDYGNIRLGSDDMAAAKLNALPTCTAVTYANAPCNDGGGVRTVPSGASFHTDWLGGWDYTTMNSWQTNCLGIGAAPHQCEPSIISSSESMSYGPNPDGNTVITTNTYGSASAGVMVLIGAAHNGPATIGHH